MKTQMLPTSKESMFRHTMSTYQSHLDRRLSEPKKSIKPPPIETYFSNHPHIVRSSKSHHQKWFSPSYFQNNIQTVSNLVTFLNFWVFSNIDLVWSHKYCFSRSWEKVMHPFKSSIASFFNCLIQFYSNEITISYFQCSADVSNFSSWTILKLASHPNLHCFC